MPSSANPTTAVSAPGKVLLAGGYLVTDRDYTGLVFGLDARINVVAQGIPTIKGVQLSEVVVESPQFVGGTWRYGYHLAPEDGGITVTQLQVGSATINPNPFIETTLSYALTYISRAAHQRASHSMQPARLTILADSSYYSTPSSGPGGQQQQYASPPGSRFIHLQTPLHLAKKTGLGSSAALVTALTAALLSHYLSPTRLDLSTDRGRAVLHNLAQTAHCRAQGKIGSGFDVAAAVYGSCLYRRFSPAVLDGVPAPGEPHFGTKLEEVVAGPPWDTEVRKDAVTLPPGVAMRMVDVECGSQTVGMVKAVNAWREKDPEGSKALWAELQSRNEALARVLAEARVDELPEALAKSRALVKKIGSESGVPIEPDSQTELIDALGGVEGVFGGVVPGAGGFDAVAVLVKDDVETAKRVETFLEEWSRKKEAKVKLLSVRGELEGVRTEKLGEFEGWLA
ncbi:Phosphomevalonate kinase [Cryphonectria parasitica EP155]|uniref:Phosphomevalonate kinase n=1 Tax=Cryphonectria parasitica (strain ATCC 38755 / EP155) TaxID=660469 RepID=A0A9P4Y580_CRYP1|nr:Phosphomevalonate kinase [Cryphonectria parasitica EP155]KAF3766906.1 Phosphomevalonate kinase [Cryphonectria parasitica EP155]